MLSFLHALSQYEKHFSSAVKTQNGACGYLENQVKGHTLFVSFGIGAAS